MPRQYQATAHREGKWWIITIPALDAVTQARTLTEIDTMATGLVTALLDLPEGEAHVQVTIQSPEPATTLWNEAQQLQQQADTAKQQAAKLRRQAIHALIKNEHLTQKETGTLLGISYQRVQQLAHNQ